MYSFEKFERPAQHSREELIEAFQELQEKGKDYSLLIDRKPQVLYHQAKILGYKIIVHNIKDTNTSRVWIK